MQIGNKIVGQELFFVVEEGQYSQGNYSKAIEMLELVSLTGADAIEYQFAYADEFYIKGNAGYSTYLKRQFSDTELKLLVRNTRDSGLEFVATCLSPSLIPKMIKFGVSAFNINASDINNPQIIDLVAASGIPFFISTPLATDLEIRWAFDRAKLLNPNGILALLHGQHTMASGGNSVNIEDTCLGYLPRLKHDYNVLTGFIDHTSSIMMPSIAVAAGADIVTKHLFPNKLTKGPDWQVCLDPVEMKIAIDSARLTHKSIKTYEKNLAPGEANDRFIMRRSIVASTFIPKGTKINCEMLAFKRPGTGISPDQIDKVVGSSALKNLNVDTIIEWKDISID